MLVQVCASFSLLLPMSPWTVTVFVQGTAGVHTLPGFCATVPNDTLLIMPEGKAKFPPSSVLASICFPL